MAEASSCNQTFYFEDGRQVYHCRCGETHRGDYAAEDWNHHNCFHEDSLSKIADDQCMCIDCGLTFTIEK